MNQRGQATILIGIIFQVVFVFFAMVINVGLLVNDKINLQNSVDIAAYYGAMKQAEVLNAMSQVNFQIRQAWKLLNWRLWALGSGGRNPNIHGSGVGLPDSAVTWTGAEYPYPLVCMRWEGWADERRIGGGTVQNLCKDAQFHVPPLKRITLGPVEQSGLFSFMQIFKAQSEKHLLAFSQDCKDGGAMNYELAGLFLVSYKVAVANRRAAMQALEKLLVEGPMAPPDDNGQDFGDVSGRSVQRTTFDVFMKNLTVANRTGLKTYNFYNSLHGQPFLVPIEVRTFLRYSDIHGGSSGTKATCDSTPKDMDQFPEGTSGGDGTLGNIFNMVKEATLSDYHSDHMTSAAEFASEPNPSINTNSLIGFEKNPWIVSYVKVKATTAPKMLFSPIGRAAVILEAEAYAMPFGSRIGPTYYDTWDPQGERSFNNGSNKVDNLLPPRLGEHGDFDGYPVHYPPNYSKFPGDMLGMQSQIANTASIVPILGSGQLPALRDGDYANIVDNLLDPQQDPIVPSTNVRLRNGEIAAVAPDLFDAVNYSIDPTFEIEMKKKGGDFFFQNICAGRCFDLGSTKNGGVRTPFTVTEQVNLNVLNGGAISRDAFWLLRNPDHINTAWTQEAADQFLPPSGMSNKIGANASKGGRTGYSVKLVSEKYLKTPMPFGGDKVPAGLPKNPPNWP